MKKIFTTTILLILLATAGNSYGQTASRLVAESRYLPGGPTLTLMPLDSTRHLFRNANSALDSQKYVYQNSQQGWVNLRKFDYMYNASNKLVHMEYRNWNSGSSAYINGGLTWFFLDGNGRCIKDSNRLWIPNNSAYRDNVRNLYTYNAAGQVLETIYDSYDPGLQGLLHTYRYVNTYNAKGRQLTGLTKEWSASLQWYDASLNTWTYDGTDTNLLNMIGKQDVNTPGVLVNVFQNVFTLNSNGSIASYLMKTWNAGTNSFSNNSMKITITYDGAGNNILETLENWNTNTSTYVPYQQVIRTYNNFKQKTSETRVNWNNTTSSYSSYQSRDNWYYETYTTTGTSSVAEKIVVAADLTLVPVPTSGMLQLSLRCDEAQSFQAIVTDITGKPCYRFSGMVDGAYSNSIDLAHLAAGNYILSIRGEKGMMVSKQIAVVR